ncbi:MAG: EamA family transporter [Jatrophihabitantaceae bacterium]
MPRVTGSASDQSAPPARPPAEGSTGSATTSMPLMTVAAVTFTLLCWASAFVGIRDAVRYFSPGSLALFRYLIASVVLAAMLAATRSPLPRLRDWPRLALVGLLGITIYNLALNFGSQSIQAGSAAFLIQTSPLFTAIFAVLLLNERVTRIAFVGMGIGFAGALMIFFGEGKEVALEPGALLILLAAVVFSLFFITQKPLLAKYNAIQVITVAVWIGTALMAPFALGLRSEIADAPASGIWVVVFLAVFPGALAYASWSYVLSRIPASKAGSLLYFAGPVTVLISWLWLSEVPTLLSLLGGLLAIGGAVIVNTWGRTTAKRNAATQP